MNRVMFYISILIFFLGTSIHVMTYFITEYLPSYDSLWIIHVLIFIPLIVLIISHYKKNDMSSMSLDDIIGNFSVKSKVLIFVSTALLTIYVGINFYFMTERASGRYVNGRLVYVNERGKRFISKDGYSLFHIEELRGISGHWLIFSYIPTIYFRNKSKGSTMSNGG